MRRSRFLGFTAAAAGASLACGLVSCLSDPRADEPVTVVETCDVAALSSDPTSPQATLRAYLDSTQSMVDMANGVEVDLVAACAAIEIELGLKPASDLAGACKSLTARINSVIARAPAQAGLNIVADWVQIGFAPKCEAPANALESCLSTCAGPCDSSKCEEGKLAATCDGTCDGTCSTDGAKVACNGKCVGEAPVTAATCQGECVGRCLGKSYTGQCEGSCAAAFVGVCGGTCTGACDGTPTNPTMDGGTEAGTEAGADAGEVDAGPTAPPGTPPRPPAGNDGNCKGTCTGVCSSKAYGDCKAACATYKDDGATVPAEHSGGICANGVCTGTCRAAKGTGSTTTCNGTCTALAKGACRGVCRGTCDGATSNVRCEGTLNCGQNIECNNACEAAALLATKCEEPTLLQLYSVSDPVLYAAIAKHYGKLGKAITQLSYLRNAFGFIGNRTYADFSRIGLSGDLTRACVAKGRVNVDAADAKIRALLAADATTRKYQ